MILKTKINNKQVIVNGYDHLLGKVFTITIGKESEVLEVLVLMLRTLSSGSSFRFCNIDASYMDWLSIYEEIINK